MKNTSDSFISGPLLFCMKIERSVVIVCLIIVYGAASLKTSEAEFERFRQAWSQYPGAVDV